MVSKFGETRGPFIVWLFFTLYSVTLIVFGGSSGGSLPTDVTMLVVLSLLIAMAIGFGPIIVFLVTFLAFWERRRSLIEIFSNVGLRRKGSVKSVFWSVALFPLFIVTIDLIMVMLTCFLGPISFTRIPNSGQVPLWYPYYMIIYAFFPIAVVEEAIGRGYMLDRLMPQHPSSLVKALPAILLSSLLVTLYHIPPYLRVYSFSLPWISALLAGNVFPWSVFLSVVYVRARTRNVIGPVLIHFLADSIPWFLMLV